MDHLRDAATMQTFVSSVENVFRTMLRQPLGIGRPSAGAIAVPERHLRATVPLTGDMQGSVCVVMVDAAAEHAARAFLGERAAIGPAELRDAIGELANMIAGVAAARFPGRRVGIGCPTVVAGPSPRPADPSAKPAATITLPCSAGFGSFAVELVLEEPHARRGAA